MQPQSESDYKKIFTELIKKQIVVLGPDITLAKVKNVQGIEVNDQGEVTSINGDPQSILQLLINQFVELSGTIVKKTTESILSAYPEMAGMATKAMNQSVSTDQKQVKPENQPQNNAQNQTSNNDASQFSSSVSQSNEPKQSNQTNIQNQTPQNENNNNYQGDKSDNRTNINDGSQMPKEDLDNINKALSELESQNHNNGQNQQTQQSPQNVENKSKDVQQSNNS